MVAVFSKVGFDNKIERREQNTKAHTTNTGMEMMCGLAFSGTATGLVSLPPVEETKDGVLSDWVGNDFALSTTRGLMADPQTQGISCFNKPSA